MTALALTLNQVSRRVAALDRVWLGLALALLFGIALAPDQTWRSLAFVAEALLYISPFLAVSVGLAAYAGASGADNLIARVFQGGQARMILIAAIFGGLSPFCSCGVIPLIAALLAMGVPLAPVMAFWLASPIMDPEMFILTAAAIGPGFATAKAAAAIALGLIGGFATLALRRFGLFAMPLKPGVGDGGCAAGSVHSDGRVAWRFWREPERWARFRRDAGWNALFLGKWLTLAFVLESLMMAYVPADAVASLLGGDSLFAVPLAVIVGVPAYLNGYAAIPLIGGLIDLGMAPAAGLAFMVAGGVTSVPAAIAVFALVRAPVFAAYIATALLGALLVGLTALAVMGVS